MVSNDNTNINMSSSSLLYFCKTEPLPVCQQMRERRYDWCVSFKTNESGDPSTFKYRLLRVKDANGTVCAVDLDLDKKQASLTATPARLVYDPAKDDSTKDVVDLWDDDE